MHDKMVETRAVFIYETNMLKAGAFSIVLGILCTPLLYLMSAPSPSLWVYLALMIFVSSFLGRKEADWRFNLIKRYLKGYQEIGTFWINNRFNTFDPRILIKFIRIGLRTCFVFGEWKYLTLSAFVYCLLILVLMNLNIVEVMTRFKVIFTILIFLEVMSFHLFFVFLNWKYRVAQRIKKEFELDYRSYASVD